MVTKAWHPSHWRIMPKTGWKRKSKKTGSKKNEESKRKKNVKSKEPLDEKSNDDSKAMEQLTEVRLESRLELLPTELLIRILDLVYIPRKNYPGHPDQECLGTRDLLSLMRCCRRLNPITTPVLWTRVVQTRSRWESGYFMPDHTRLALERPELCKYVRTVILHDSIVDTTGPHASLGKPRTAPAFSELVPDGYKSLLATYNEWISYGTLLLQMCQHVSTLELNMLRKNHSSKLRPLEFAFASTYWFEGQFPFLPNLKELSVSFDQGIPKSGLRSLIFLLKHPSLETFNGFNVTNSDFYWALESNTLVLPLKTLRLEKSNIGLPYLGRILSSCANLESVMYDHDQRDFDEAAEFKPEQFIRKLKHLKPSLRELILFRREKLRQTILFATPESLMPIGSLGDFTALSHLAITAHLLLGHQVSEGSDWSRHYRELLLEPTYKLRHVLPKSLRQLRLMNCGSAIIQDALDLIEVKEDVVPELESVVLEFQDLQHGHYMGNPIDMIVRRMKTHMMVDEVLLGELEARCKEKGVLLDVWYN